MRIVVIDDHPLVRKGIEMVAGLEQDIQVVGFASNGAEALEQITSLKPNVALVDLRLPGEHGLDIIKKSRKVHKECKYVILTSYANEIEIQEAMKEEVDGYILKEALPEELIAALRLVVKGRKYYDPVVVQFAMGQNSTGEEDGISRLTPREMEVLGALSKGYNNKTIAEQLVISEHTVKKHIGQVLEKLNLKDRTQAALYAVSKGIGKK
ncbi:response regulator transcription factor [Candidatus Contubernalis alkalaceticus]|nr:response regulator transcription factor [Candidatus Contubernalis alkalaceticus]